MVDRLKVINFLQDFGCARLNQLQKLFNAPEDNFRNILTGNLVNKKVIYLCIIIKLLIIVC